MLVDKKVMEILRSDRGGYNNTITHFFGYRHPLSKSWKKEILLSNIEISDKEFDYLYQNRNTLSKDQKKPPIFGRKIPSLFLENTKGPKKKSVTKLGLDVIDEYEYVDTWENRNARLEELGMTYQEYLASDEWKKIRHKASKRARYKKCAKCGSKKKIHLHHKNYKWLGTKNAMVNIIPLCADCHDEVHQIAKSENLSVSKATRNFLSTAKEKEK